MQVHRRRGNHAGKAVRCWQMDLPRAWGVGPVIFTDGCGRSVCCEVRQTVDVSRDGYRRFSARIDLNGTYSITRLRGHHTRSSRMGHYRERISRPHLSLSVPHCSQVSPPHRACLSDCGLRSCGIGALQDGHEVGLRLTPQRFLFTVPTATSTAPVNSRPKTVASTTTAAYLRCNQAVAQVYDYFAQCLENGAVSMGRCNTGLKFTSGSLKAQSFSRALIQL
jgi:hypothetical protein